MLNIQLTHIRQALAKPLPGKEVQYIMAPQGRDLVKPLQKGFQKAAVLILLYNQNQVLQTVFMKRPAYQGPHSGQISPGGKFEDSDVSLAQTALRETYEEIGIHPNKIEIIGKLTPLFIPISNFEVHPFVGFCSQTPTYNIDNKEVDELIIPSLALLSNPQIIKNEIWELHNQSVNAPFYLVENNKIWGATAMILSEFLYLCRG